MKPTEINDFMKQSVIGQEEALRFVSVAIYKHLCGEPYGNLMLIGNSGTGKTTIMRAMEKYYASLTDNPQYRVVVVMNANTFATEEGSVDTSLMLKRLEERSRQILGDDASAEDLKEHMENATVCLDEIDKVSGIVGGKPYVMGINIQQALLTLIEGEKVLWPMTIYKDKTPERVAVTIDTGKMLFLCAGAFEKLYDQVYERVTAPTSKVKLPTETFFVDGEVQIREYFTLRHHFKQEDLFDYGMQPQFLSRFDNELILQDLNPVMLKQIFMNTDDSVFKASQNFFKSYGIDLQITDGAVQKISEEAAANSRIGARALKAVYGRIIKPYEYDPFTQEDVKQVGDGHQLTIDEDLVKRALNPDTHGVA
ncbi:hypothetical protein ABI59_16245 [Acidobacteria bacterium Mor1]|nr:hypothetical protein ABI59_16245 [Acidobacteria bacterium Mor1]